MPTNFIEWDRQLKLASEEIVAETILRFQKNLVFLTLGAAIEITPGNIQKILGVVLRTPVKTGMARASWNVSTGAMDLTIPAAAKGGRDRDGRYLKKGQNFAALSHAQAAKALRKLGLYDVVWIASGLPYISVLEFGGYPNPPALGTWVPKKQQFEIRSAGGFSKMAPAGMVRITMDEISEIIS